MTRSQLITKVANDTNMTSAEVEKVMDGIFGTIGDVLKSGDKVTIAGFGRFEMRERQTKNFTNPKTKVTSKLEPTAIPGFKASGRFKQKLEAGMCFSIEPGIYLPGVGGVRIEDYGWLGEDGFHPFTKTRKDLLLL